MIIFTNFHEDWTKNVNFQSMANFSLCLRLYLSFNTNKFNDNFKFYFGIDKNKSMRSLGYKHYKNVQFSVLKITTLDLEMSN